MAPVFLLTAGFSIALVILLFLGARHLDRRLRQIDPEADVRQLRATVERLEQRVRHLEAIAAEDDRPALPDAPPATDAEAPPAARRTRTR